MTISYHSGGRLQGTSTDYNSGDGISASYGGWKEIGRTTLGSTTSTIDVASLADKRYLMLLTDIRPSGAVDGMMRLNNDSGSNYACRFSNNGGSDGTDTSASLMYNAETPSDTNPMFAVSYIANLSNKQKLHLSHSIAQKTAGAGNAPNRGEYACKWVNTSDAVDRITTLTSTGNNYASGSEVVVLGWDEDDTHSDNFWEQIGTGTGSSIADISITSKKYNWVQAYVNSTSSSSDFRLRLGNTSLDTGSNYGERRSTDGGTDATDTSATGLRPIGFGLDSGESAFLNFFFINNASNEKLIYLNTTTNQAGLGAGTAPNRFEMVGKWSNTSNQADRIGIAITAGSVDTNSFVKVWGSN